ncbi:MAG TPA: PEPxxWA-CTERM sorting domain-containing protein [Burkholderiales bacterium]|nr:PEPxxWA-CTERM sorting domain-containing protein [Burkholderiales bacterium]
MLAVSAPASAATLLDLTNMPQQFVTPAALTFTATSTSTTIDFQAYQLPGSLAVVNIYLALTGTVPSTATNLLGQTFTATPSGCAAPGNTFGNGSLNPNAFGTNDITFGGTCIGLYDSLAQTVNTTIGASYTLRFSFSNIGQGPNGFRIFANDAGIQPVPEPAAWMMMLLGFGAVGMVLRVRRKAVAAAQ